MHKIRVSVVSATHSRGGAGKAAFRIAAALSRKKQVEISFFHAEDRASTDIMVGLKRPMSRPFNAAMARLMGPMHTKDFGFAARLLALSKETDVFHLHNLHGYYLNYIKLLTHIKKRPIVWTWHDMWGATGRCAFSMECDRWVSGCQKCPHKDFYPAAWVDRARNEYKAKTKLFGTLSYLTIVTPSDWLKTVAVQRGFSEEIIRVIPNCIDAEFFRHVDENYAKNQLGLDSNKRYLLFVAADCSDPRKGFADFIEVISMLGASGIAIGRPVSSQFKNVDQVGFVTDPSRLALFYNACDAMLLPSLGDNYPNTVVEALSCGTPVFGYDVGGVSSQIPNPENYLVKVGDYRGLACLVEAWKKAPLDTKKSRMQLRAYAKAKWAPAVISEAYLSVYRDALGSVETKSYEGEVGRYGTTMDG